MPINVRREFSSVGLASGSGVFAPAPLPSGELEATRAVGGATLRRFRMVADAIDTETRALVQRGEQLQQVGGNLQLGGRDLLRTFRAVEDREREANALHQATTVRARFIQRAGAIQVEAREHAGPSGQGFAGELGRRLNEAAREEAQIVEDEARRQVLADQLALVIASESAKARGEEARIGREFKRREHDAHIGIFLDRIGNQRPGAEQALLLATVIDEIRDYGEAGVYTPAEVERRIQSVRSTALKATLSALEECDPADGLALIGDGALDHLFASDAERQVAERALRESARRRERDALILIERREQLDDKARKDAQAITAIDAYQAAFAGRMTTQQLDSLARTRQLAAGDWLKIRDIVTGRQDVEDDPFVVLQLTDDILEGQAGRDDIWDAAVERRISAGTAGVLLDKLATEARRATPFQQVVASHDYKSARDAVRSAVMTTGPMQALDLGEQERLSNAFIELDDRIRQRLDDGEQVTPDWLAEVRDDIRRRYRSGFRPSALSGLPRSDFLVGPVWMVRPRDVDAAQRRLVEAYRAKTIDRDTFNREAELLERYGRLLQQQEGE